MTEISTSKYKLNADKDNPRFINDGMNELERNIKRLIDMFAALICLVIFSPLFLICYIAIKREDGGPAIYKQERIGRFGRPFYIYKFRSMVVDAEKDGPALYKHDRETRMTKIGKFLRAHHLDELPQLWNVVKGEMAFIGPRPERKFYIDQIMQHDPRYVYLYQVRPGSHRMQRYTMAIRTRWRKCCVDWNLISIIWSIALCGLMQNYWY